MDLKFTYKKRHYCVCEGKFGYILQLLNSCSNILSFSHTWRNIPLFHILNYCIFYYRLNLSQGKLTTAMIAYVSIFKVMNSKPFQNMGFIPGMFINRSKLLIIQIRHLTDPNYCMLIAELCAANLWGVGSFWDSKHTPFLPLLRKWSEVTCNFVKWLSQLRLPTLHTGPPRHLTYRPSSSAEGTASSSRGTRTLLPRSPQPPP